MDSPSPAPAFDPHKSPAGFSTPEALTGVTADDKLWAMLAHLAGLLGYVTALGQYIGPLVIYLMYKEKSKFVAYHALQSLYFQLMILAAGLLIFVVGFVVCIAWLLGFPLAVAALVFNIIAALKANNGEMYEYWLVGKWARDQVGI